MGLEWISPHQSAGNYFVDSDFLEVGAAEDVEGVVGAGVDEGGEGGAGDAPLPLSLDGLVEATGLDAALSLLAAAL